MLWSIREFKKSSERPWIMPFDLNHDVIIRKGIAAPPVIFLHGFLGAKDDWRPVFRELSAHADCIAIDLPGHGEQGANAPVCEFSAAVGWLDDLRRHLGLESWHVVGYSLGGRLALAYACAYPGRVRSLTMVSASPGIEDEKERAERRERDKAWAQDMVSSTPEEFISRWYQQPVFSSLHRDPVLLSNVCSKRVHNNMHVLADVLLQWGAGVVPPRWSAMSSLPMPVQWIAGELDAAYVAMARRIEHEAPNVVVRVLTGAGHTVQLEQPVELGHSILRFIMNPAGKGME
jgi:2-succinyl-6-hydroxy-2,4-cyclohexadiene-1-carboxylate synthase